MNQLLLCFFLFLGMAAAQAQVETPRISIHTSAPAGTVKQLVHGNGIYVAYFLYPAT